MSKIALDLLGHSTRKDDPAMRQLTSLDAQFLALEDDRTQGHVSALATYDSEAADGRRLDAALVRELVTDRLHLLPTFRWRLAQVPLGLDHPYWVDDPSVDVDYHVRELALPSPGDDRQLAEQVARIAARPLDRSHPLWEIYVIHGLQDGAVGLLTKMHHAAVDGASGAEVMGVLLDETPGGHVLNVRDIPAVERHPSRREMLWRGLAGISRYPLRAVRAAPRALPHLDAIPTIRPVPGVNAVARTSRLINRMIPGTNDCAAPACSDLTRPADAVPSANFTTPPRRVRLTLARRGQGGQEHLRVHGQRRRHGDVRDRAARLAVRTGRAARPAAGRVGAHVRPHPG